jgi:hypothetical protein
MFNISNVFIVLILSSFALGDLCNLEWNCSLHQLSEFVTDLLETNQIVDINVYFIKVHFAGHQ